MKVRIASEASICWSFARPSEWRPWILIWISSWDPLKLCDAIRRTTSAPPGQIARQGRISKHCKPSQQRSDQAGKPVNSEQDSCSFSSISNTRNARQWRAFANLRSVSRLQFGQFQGEIADSLRRIFEIFPFLGDGGWRPGSICTAWRTRLQLVVY
jgi:hypothetical protein